MVTRITSQCTWVRTTPWRAQCRRGKARRAAQLQDQFKVEGVPALGVGGRFYIDGSLAGSMERALQITDHLGAEIRKGR